MNFLNYLLDKNEGLLNLLGATGSPLYRIGFFGEWFILCFFLFALLARSFPSIQQPAFPSSLRTDSLYWFAGPIVYAPVFVLFIGFYASFMSLQHVNGAISGFMHRALPVVKAQEGHLHFTDLLQASVVVQALLILLISDFIQYWLHRFFHRDPLWKYHSIHHSPTHLDWLTSARFHPVNIILYSTSVNAFVAMLGFDIEAFLILQPFNMLYSPLVHANLNWNYGPFRYIVASPMFHRWHHTYPEEGGDKNFAPTFAFLDVMFGTFYMPKGRRPEVFGIEGNPVPNHFLGQMAHPFKKPKV